MFNNLSIVFVLCEALLSLSVGIGCLSLPASETEAGTVTVTWWSVEYGVADENCHLCQEKSV